MAGEGYDAELHKRSITLAAKERDELLDRAVVARREAESKGIHFSMRSWALGLPGSTKYPMRPPYQPMVQGFPTYLQTVANFNMKELATIGFWSTAAYGTGYALGFSDRFFIATRPHMFGVIAAGMIGASATYRCMCSSRSRLLGFSRNGRPRNPGFEDWEDDSAPTTVKFDRAGERTIPVPAIMKDIGRE